MIKKQLIDKDYRTLEEQIIELWESCGLKVVREIVEPLENGKFKWIIIAEQSHAQKRKNN